MAPNPTLPACGGTEWEGVRPGGAISPHPRADGIAGPRGASSVQRRRLPELPAHALLISVFKQLLHIAGIEAVGLGCRILGIDRRQVDLPVPALGKLIGGNQRISRI